MRELIVKEIDGKVYEFSQYNTTTSLKVLTKLTKLLGESLTIAVSSFTKDAPKENIKMVDGVPVRETVKSLGDKEVNSDSLAKAVKVLVDRLDEDEVIHLVRKLTTEGVLCNNLAIVFDDHFAGDFMHLFKVLKASIEAQYGSFLGGVTAIQSAVRMHQGPIVNK